MPRFRPSVLSSILTLIFCLFAASSANAIWVTTLVDEDVNNGVCSLREAIKAANMHAPYGGCSAGPGTETIEFYNVSGTINLNAPLPDITTPLNITGSGANRDTVAGNNTFRLLNIALPAALNTVKITGLSFTGGRRTAPGNAAAIEFNNSVMDTRLIIDHCEFYGNSGGGAGDDSSVLFARVLGFLTLDGSTFRNNSADHVIRTGTDMAFTFTNVTISDNTGSGAAIYVSSNAPLGTIVNSTVTNNNIGLWHANTAIESPVKIKNSIFAENVSGNLKRTPVACPSIINNIVSDGYNIFDDDPGGNLCAPVATDLINTAPKLAPLALDGGTVQTRIPLYTSPARDRIPGQPGLAFPSPDQRGAYRAIHGKADVGAVEMSSYVTSAASSGEFTLIEALSVSPLNSTIQFDPVFFSVPRTIALTNTLFRSGGITINGPGAHLLTIAGNGTFKLFSLATAPRDVVTFNDISFTGGAKNFFDSASVVEIGGGIEGGKLNINRCEFYGNGTAAAPGDMIYAINAQGVSINASTLRNNVARHVIYSNEASLDIVNSTISGNTGTGAAVYLGGGQSTVNITSSTITGNNQGIWNASNFSLVTVNLKSTILSRNGNTNLKRSGIASCNLIKTSGNNLIDDDTWGQFVNSDQTDLLGASFDPRLAPLDYYGGPTRTHALKAGSAAIDAGGVSGLPPTDQRGSPRIIGPAADIGSFERNITFDQASLPVGRANNPYNGGNPYQLTVTRQALFTAMKGAEPFTVEVFAPASFAVVPSPGQTFPPGLTLSPDGKISGVPTLGGTYTFTLKATDTDGMAGAAQYAMNVLAPPTAAHVSAGGRVTDSAGRAIPGALVRMTSISGHLRSALTNAFGYYRFDDVQAGETYMFNAASKRYRFDPRVITVNDELADLDFVAR
jgi:CSLREA domain-containing protein